MKYFKIMSVTLLSVFFLQACNDDSDKKDEVVIKTTIVDAAVSNGNFTTLVAALQATGLDTTLADMDSSFTVFAPTDDAFALLGQDTINALLADTETLSDILTYHVISGEVNATTAISLAGTTVDMVNGDRPLSVHHHPYQSVGQEISPHQGYLPIPLLVHKGIRRPACALCVP